MDTRKAEQKAKVLAFLLLSEITGNRCTPEDLSCSCLAFQVTAEEIRGLCKLPNVPLRLLENDRLVGVAKTFDIRINSLLSLLHNQVYNIGTGAAKHVVDAPASWKDDFVGARPISTREPLVARPDFEGVNAIQPEQAVIEIKAQANPGNPLQRIEDSRLVIHDGNLYDPLERAEKAHLATPQVENPNNALQRIEDSRVVIKDGNLCGALERAEKTPLPTAAVNLAEQGFLPLLKKPRARSVPRFEDYDVDGEVGAGGYGTVYKVRRHSDGQVFAMKCPLENTHDCNVRNEINMLKRLRGKDYIIQIQNEVIGKVSPKPDAGVGEEVNCPSILLEFIEHDKPEILKKEITIDELKWYSISLFKALVQLHKERILHLDVKPGNFLFSRTTKKGCLVDFNLARDESAKRLSTRGRPERCSSRPVIAETKTSERRECPKRARGHEDAPRTCVKPSKRSRTICKNAGMLLQSRPDSATGAITAPVKHPEPCKVNESLDNTGNSKKTTKQKLRVMAKGNHRLAKALQFVIDKPSNPSMAPDTQTTGVIKANPNKRVPAELPPLPQSVQPSSAKRLKPVIRVKVAAPRHQVKDGPCVGTKGYRAPEVLMRSTKQTTKVDIWSAGVSLLQLVTGRSPFPTTSTEGALKDIAKLRGAVVVDNLAKSLGQRHLFFQKDQPYPGVSVKEWSDKHSRRTDLKGRIPSTLYDLIEKCLDVNPESRITAEEVIWHRSFLMTSSGMAPPMVMNLTLHVLKPVTPVHYRESEVFWEQLHRSPEDRVSLEARSDNGYYEGTICDSEGKYRLRGLLPDTTYTIWPLVSGSPVKMERSSPGSVTLKVTENDTSGVQLVNFDHIDWNCLGFQRGEMTILYFDIGFVDD